MRATRAPLFDGAAEELGWLPIETQAAGGGPTEYVITPSGGVAFSGSVTLLRGKVFTSSGGVTFGGTATYETHSAQRIITPSGGVVFSGTADVIFDGNGNFVINPSGGIVFGGTAGLIKGRVLPVSGGISFAGTAPYITHNSENIITPSGGIVFSGHANVIYTAFGTEVARAKGMLMMQGYLRNNRRYRRPDDIKNLV